MRGAPRDTGGECVILVVPFTARLSSPLPQTPDGAGTGSCRKRGRPLTAGSQEQDAWGMYLLIYSRKGGKKLSLGVTTCRVVKGRSSHQLPLCTECLCPKHAAVLHNMLYFIAICILVTALMYMLNTCLLSLDFFAALDYSYTRSSLCYTPL